MEGDQAALADMPQVPLGDHTDLLGQWPQSHVVPYRPVPDDLAMSAVHLARRSGTLAVKAAVHLLDRRGGPSGQHVVANDADLALDPTLGLGPIGGQHVDVEVVVPCERDRLRGAAGPPRPG